MVYEQAVHTSVVLSVQVGWEAGAGGAVSSGSQTQGKKTDSGNKNLPCGPLEFPGFGTGAEHRKYTGKDRPSALLGGLGC